VTQLPLLDERQQLDEHLQNEFARAAHWVEPPSRIRTSQRPVRADYGAWLEHVAGCEECGLARDDLVELRAGRLEAEPAVPCSTGIRLLPLTDLNAACAGIGRGEHDAAVRRLLDHARKLDGWGPEARMNPGQAWESEGPNRHGPRARRAG